MSTPQNPYGSGDGSPDNPNGQNPNNQPPSAPDYGNDPNSGQQPPQYGSQPNYGQGGNDGAQGQQPPQYGSQPNYGQGDASQGQQPPQYGSQPNYGQGGNDGAQGQQPPQYGSQPNYGQPNDQNQYGSQPNYGAPNDPYGQNQYGDNQGQYGAPNDPYGQNPYDANAQGYDADQYGQQPAYAGAGGSSDQFIPANPNAAYGQYPSGSGGNTSKNIWGILALIGGIVGILLSGFIIGGLLGAAAVIFGFVGLSAIKKGLATNKGLNITGLILGFVAIALSIGALILWTLGIGGLLSMAGNTDPDSPPNSTAPADPSQGSDGGDAAPAQAGEVEIGDDVTAMINVAEGTAGEYASGAESTNGEIAVVTMTVKNDSSADVKMTLTNLTATDGGSKEYQDVIDGTDYKGALSFTDPVPAGGEMTYKLAFGVPKAEIDDMHLKLELIEDLGKGKDFEFYKQ